MNLFDVLSFDERVIVASRVDSGFVVTWNKSLTFSLYYVNDCGNFEEIECKTSGQDDLTFEQARRIAVDWLAE